MTRLVGGEEGEGVARAGGRGCDQAGRRGGGRGMVRPKEGRKERVWPGR